MLIFLTAKQAHSQQLEVCETVKVELGDKSEQMRIVDVVQKIYDHLAGRNDGNKVYKVLEGSKTLGGATIKNYGQFLGSLFEDYEDKQMYFKVDI